MFRFSDVPRPAVALGAAGLLPALGCLAAAVFGPADWRDQVFLLGTLYAAVILSFLGGTWWALSCTHTPQSEMTPLLVFSAIPPLAAWIAVFFLTRASLLLMAALFIAGLAVDRRLLKLGLAPAWWFNLRLPLSAGMALLSVLIALAS